MTQRQIFTPIECRFLVLTADGALSKSTAPRKKPKMKLNKSKAVKSTVKELKKLRKSLAKSTIDPRPYATGRGAPAQRGTTAWDRADAFVDDVLRRGSIPTEADGATQREVIAQIALLEASLEKETTPGRKADIGAALTLLKLRASHEMQGLAKGPYGVGNSGNISAAGERAGVTGAGSLADLHRAMDAGRIYEEYANGPLPTGTQADIRRGAELDAAAKQATDPLERERLGFEATLAKLRAHAKATKFGAGAVGARKGRSTVTKATDTRIGELSRHLDRLKKAASETTEPTTKAELQEQASAISLALTKERLRRFHEVTGR